MTLRDVDAAAFGTGPATPVSSICTLVPIPALRQVVQISLRTE
jgi:hypothetical protein